jgi:Tfp pilus assembly protein PilF
MYLAVVHLAVVFSSTAHAQDADEFFRQGSRSFAAQDRPAAIAAFRKSIEIRPDFAPAWKALGVVFASQGDFENAEAGFRNACKHQSTLADACLYHGRTLYLLNRFQPAVDQLRSVLQREKENAEAWRLLALSLEALGEIPSAGDAFRQAVRFNRGASPNEDPGIDYGVYLLRQGHAEEAIAPLDAAAVRHPESFRAQLELGCVQLALDRLDEAAAHLQRAVALEPRGTRAHLLLGKVYQRQGKDREAAEQSRLGSSGK